MSRYIQGKSFTLLFLVLSAFAVQAQSYSNDFENGYTWYPPWNNIVIQDGYCLCDSTMEYGLGFSLPLHDSLTRQNLHLHFQADYRYPDTTGHGEIVFTVIREGKAIVWQSHPLEQFANDSAEWFQAEIDIDLPADYLPGSTLSAYLWNPQKEHILIDNATLDLTSWQLPSFLPNKGGERLEVRGERWDSLSLYLSPLTSHLTPLTSNLSPLTSPIALLNEYILDGDTLTSYQPFIRQESPLENQYMAVSEIDTCYASLIPQENRYLLATSSHFHQDCRLLRQAIVIPFLDSTLTLYRKTMAEETDNLSQSEYYLDREGFKIGKGERSIVSYHQNLISSTQYDAANQVAYFNLDYWRDHPMIHYPLSDSLRDHFEDHSSLQIHKGMQWDHIIHLYIGIDIQHPPRIMPIPDGYEAGIIFTEHADWTDLRTHRAVLFGNEHITKAKNATGGFVYYGIPMTKSVFYNNPDQVTNHEASHGAFPGLHTTIKTDRQFERLLHQLDKIGFDICLHTPEQYTTTPGNLKEALDYMESHFASTTWIDHGYNNGSMNNREDMVCDGLDRNSSAFSADQWRKHGIKYFWNPYYEENKLEQWCFDNNLMQPYPGFGDALPNRQVTLLEPHLPPLTSHLSPLTWCTPSTLDAHSDLDWDYYYSEERLQRLVDHHSVHITHVYPAWTDPARAFWTYDEDSTIIALPGMNRALARIAAFRDEHKILPMTVKTYLDYYSSLLKIDYEILDATHIRLHNQGGKIEGFTLLCPSPIRFEDNRYYEFRKSGDYYYVWFDLNSHEEVTIKIEK